VGDELGRHVPRARQFDQQVDDGSLRRQVELVVGSPARSNWAAHASAMAMTLRWQILPERSKG
jgi:hypothetical protein